MHRCEGGRGEEQELPGFSRLKEGAEPHLGPAASPWGLAVGGRELGD